MNPSISKLDGMALAEFGGRPVSLSPGKSLGADSILTGGTEIEKLST